MSEKKYWKTQEELENTELFKELSNKEFKDEIPVNEFLGDEETMKNSDISRKDFLKYIGFSTAVVSMASCKGPVNKIIPYVTKPDNITLGEAEYFATTIDNGEDFSSVLVKTREGRPIKIEPNKDAPFFNTTNARVQAEVLSLYDKNRLHNPKVKENDTTWEKVHNELKNNIYKVNKEEKEIAVLSNTVNSPSVLNLIKELKDKYNKVNFIEYDAISNSARLDAYEDLRGVRALPNYNFKKAKYIVSFDADFLGNWDNGIYRKEYADGRDPKKQMSKHIQFESLMSITGANADQRIPIKPSEQDKILLRLLSMITGNKGYSKGKTDIDDKLSLIGAEMRTMPKDCIILSDSKDINIQKILLEFNKPLEKNNPLYLNKGNDKDFDSLVSRMNKGEVGTIILNNVNPIYNSYKSKEFEKGLSKVNLKVQLTEREDETSKNMDYLLPINHTLEEWKDSEPINGYYTLTQPVIQKVFNTKSFGEVLLNLLKGESNYYGYLKNYWKDSITTNWNKSLHDGYYNSNKNIVLRDNNINTISLVKDINIPKSKEGIELTLYQKEGMGNGNNANNPWLQELPDPITRTTWDNYITINKTQAKELGLRNWHLSDGALMGDKINILLGNEKLENIPVFIQAGQKYGTIGLALGYGRYSNSIKKEMQVGVNAYPLYKNKDRNQTGIKLEKVEGNHHKFACIQLHNTMMGRKIVNETTFDIFKNNPKKDWNPDIKLDTHKGKEAVNKIDLWKEVDRTTGHHFNLSIDLNKCIGCGVCAISCQAENNIPVVGKEEMSKSRDMHWIRIDRYFSSDTKKEDETMGTIERLSKMEEPSESPEVVFQPVMCQHCNHAPCETVCPVSATSHGKEGQNQMAYNRCVGTRYCANNCPYKVRRFNWFKYYNNSEFDYTMNDDLYRMVLNPDVVVRERGVMEKCSLCIQRTQEGKLQAKMEGRELQDDDIQVACASSCPTDAIIFGDINNEKSKIQEALNDDRKYNLLEEIGVKPNVMYQTKIRNKKIDLPK